MSRPDWWREPRAPFTGAVLAAAFAHANADAPRESCGVVVAGRYRPIRNVAGDPEAGFRADPLELLAAHEEGPIEGVVHSHPEGPWRPSAADLAGQQEMGAPWAIVTTGDPGELVCAWGDGRPPLFEADGALTPRAFLHGVSDCYSAVIDYYAERLSIELPDFPRDADWWEDGQDLYRENFAAAGFDCVTGDPTRIQGLARAHDVVLRAIKSRRPNHAGVVLERSLILEHHANRLVERRPFGHALIGATHLLRHRRLG